MTGTFVIMCRPTWRLLSKTTITQDVLNIQSKLQTEIEKRPTRRQSVFDIAWVVGLIAASVTLGARALH